MADKAEMEARLTQLASHKAAVWFNGLPVKWRAAIQQTARELLVDVLMSGDVAELLAFAASAEYGRIRAHEDARAEMIANGEQNVPELTPEFFGLKIPPETPSTPAEPNTG